MTTPKIPLLRRQSPRTIAWFLVALTVVIMTASLPVNDLEESKTYYVAAPALLAFAFSLAGSFLASIIDDWRTLGRRQPPWLQLILAALLTLGTFFVHFVVLDIFAKIPKEALRLHGLPDSLFNWVSWVVFVSAWVVPPISTILSSRPIGIVKPLGASK